MPDGPRPPGPDYDEDFYAWTQYQAEVLRSLRTDDNRFDREHLAEEIEDLGKSERKAVRSEARRILEHLLKLAYSPAAEPRADWERSIIDARANLEDDLSPTLRRDIEETIEKQYRIARRQAAAAFRKYGEIDALRRLPVECPYTLEQVLRDDWYPEPVAIKEGKNA